MPHCRRISIWLLCLCGAGPLSSGCNLVSEPLAAPLAKDSLANFGSSTAAEVERLLADAEWVIAPSVAAADEPNGVAPRPRWRHTGLEAVLSRHDARARLRSAARSGDAAIAATAAIGLARLDEPEALEGLEKAARDINLKLPARGAAIEAIGRLTTSKADDALEDLAEEYGQFRGPAQARYVPELHADLVRTMADRAGNRHAESLQTALASPAPAVRLEAARAYLSGRRAAPRELVDRAADDAASVRAVAVRALAISHHEEAQACAVRALDDYNLAVRLAAIEALGALPAVENAAQLKALAENSTDVIRAAVVKSLAVRGDTSAVVDAANDKSWRVRAVAADNLLRLSYADREPLARALVADASLEVQRRMVQGLAAWPLEEAVPLLLTAIEGRTAATRRAAAEQLQARWPPAAELSPGSPRERLAAEAARLREVWQREHGRELASRRSKPPIHGPQRDMTEPESDELIAAIERLAAGPLHQRRAAARELALKYGDSRLPETAHVRLRELLEGEADALVWNDVLLLVRRDTRLQAAQLAAIAASHPSGDVRRRACEYFGEHPGTHAVKVLVNSLADEDATVVHQAVRSLGNQRDVPNFAALEALLMSPDISLRQEAAEALVRLGSATGMRALLRLTHHHDPAVRRQAARALGTSVVLSLRERNHHAQRDDYTVSRRVQQINESHRNEAIAELVRLLDDRADVRRAASLSLEQIGEKD